jgi:hypothetical protein
VVKGVTDLELYADLKNQGVITDVGLKYLPADTTQSEFESLCFMIGGTYNNLKWLVGDLIVKGEGLFGHDVYQLVEALDISADSRAQYARVASAIPLERRRSELKWSHHRAVVALGEDEQDKWLGLAVENGWNRGEMDARIRPPKEGRQIVVEELIRAANVVVDEADENIVSAAAIDDLRRALGR